jgi:FkbH-like protein
MNADDQTPVSGIFGRIIEAAPACLAEPALLKSVAWKRVASETVADMLRRIGDKGATVPSWLAEELVLAGHHIDDAGRKDLPPVIRALEALNRAGADSATPESLESALAGIAAETEPDGAALNLLARRLVEKGLASHAAALALRYWQQLPAGSAALQAAVRREIETYPEMTLELLCFSTAHVLAADLERAFAATGLRARIERKAFAEVWPALLEPPGSYGARILVLDAESLFPCDGRPGPAQSAERFAAQAETLVQAVETAAAASSRPLIVSTLPRPAAPSAGFLDGWHGGGLSRAVDSVNRRLLDIASRYGQLTLIDSDIAMAGIAPAARSDPKLWYYGRLAFAPSASRALAAAIADAWRALKQGRAKVLALDLDNTLWGGIVGEDGAGKLACGDEFPGNAYKAFQEECLRLKGQGMLLAILSKNDAQAIETFAQRADMPLTPDDFVARRIDWQPKPDNIRSIAAELNLGLDSFIFLDDSPHERDAMRCICPEVGVPEMPADPARRPGWLRAMRETWPLALTREDEQRSDFYAAERKSLALRAAASSFEDFLASLDQRVLVAFTDASTVARIAQMHAKTNQFNLTTRRFDEAALLAMIAAPETHAVMHAQVTDKFGDHGIVAAAALRFEADAAHIESLLMSCRVIGRRVEHAFMDEILRFARDRGAAAVHGTYLRTEKNGLVADFYGSAGFRICAEDERGSAWVWTAPGADMAAASGRPRAKPQMMELEI